MRMHVYKYIVAMSMAIVMMMQTISVLASDMIETTANEMIAETVPVVETITIENELMWDGDVPADIRWKTKQDKGQWIEELEVLEGANSLILIVNNLDKEDPDALPSQEIKVNAEVKTDSVGPGQYDHYIWRGVETEGHSSLMYLSKNADGEWVEILSAECKISGGELQDNETIYGVYCPEKTFGNLQNPGSLLPYKELVSEDFWILDPEDERYGDIYTANSLERNINGAVNLCGMKIFFNYGMIVRAENENSKCSKLLLNCYQPESRDVQYAGIQIPEETLRILVQCVDEGTRMVIVGSVDELSNLS